MIYKLKINITYYYNKIKNHFKKKHFIMIFMSVLFLGPISIEAYTEDIMINQATIPQMWVDYSYETLKSNIDELVYIIENTDVSNTNIAGFDSYVIFWDNFQMGNTLRIRFYQDEQPTLQPYFYLNKMSYSPPSVIMTDNSNWQNLVYEVSVGSLQLRNFSQIKSFLTTYLTNSSNQVTNRPTLNFPYSLDENNKLYVVPLYFSKDYNINVPMSLDYNFNIFNMYNINTTDTQVKTIYDVLNSGPIPENKVFVPFDVSKKYMVVSYKTIPENWSIDDFRGIATLPLIHVSSSIYAKNLQLNTTIDLPFITEYIDDKEYYTSYLPFNRIFIIDYENFKNRYIEAFPYNDFGLWFDTNIFNYQLTNDLTTITITIDEEDYIINTNTPAQDLIPEQPAQDKTIFSHIKDIISQPKQFFQSAMDLFYQLFEGIPVSPSPFIILFEFMLHLSMIYVIMKVGLL